MSLDPVALIDTRAIAHNLQRAAALSGHSRLMAVIKADGYGHGLLRVARALGAADALAVARVSEAVKLRQQGIQKLLVVLEGFLDVDELQAATKHDLVLTIHNRNQLTLLQQQTLSSSLRLWVKVDTGMNRLGFNVEDAVEIVKSLQQLDNVKASPGLMTHLACADDPNSESIATQLARFAPLTSAIEGKTSIANSAGIIGWPASQSDWARPGLMLYGANPFGMVNSELDLQPAMTFSARLIAIKEIKAGDAVGYGSTWRSPEAMSIGVVGVGYGDGYPREIRQGTPVLINSLMLPIVGRVSMDMLTVDLRQLPEARLGDKVTLWGKGLPIEQIAAAANTISYTLMCGIAPRVARIETDQ